MSDEAKCSCQHCDEHIAFPLELSGQTIECPHCKLETLLFARPAETDQIVNCPCQHCSGLIEFEASKLVEENSLVQCPHCGHETKLFTENGQVDKEALFSLAKDKSVPLSERIAAFKAYSKANKPERDSQLREMENFVKQHETSALIRNNDDELELSEDRVLIRKRGWANALASGMNGERSIPISSLTTIQLKLGGTFTMGYILFSYAGSKPFMGGLWEATQDPDCFLFKTALNEQVANFKAKVEKIMRDSKQVHPPTNPSVTLTEELRKLAEFRQQGILSEQEFEAAKKKLLA
jgi:hypothetical protein